MVDLSAGGSHAGLTADDFLFKVGTSNDPSTWTSAPAPTAISVRLGAGVEGSDRIVITWANSAIQNQWLQVIVKGNDALGEHNTRTGLASSDVFFFGNRIGDTFSNSPPTVVTTNANDEISVRNAVSAGKPITNAYDFNKDMLVNVADQIVARTNIGALTRVINWAPPAAPKASPVLVPEETRENAVMLERLTLAVSMSGHAAAAPGSSAAENAARPSAPDRPSAPFHFANLGDEASRQWQPPDSFAPLDPIEIVSAWDLDLLDDNLLDTLLRGRQA